MTERLLEFGELHRVAFREFGDLLGRPPGVTVEQQGATVTRRSEQLNVRANHLEAVATEIHVPDDLARKRSCRVRQRRALEARVEFVRNRSASGDRAALEQQWLKPRFREVESGDQRVVPGPDDDDVPSS